MNAECHTISNVVIMAKRKAEKQTSIKEIDVAYRKLKEYLIKMENNGRKSTTINTYYYVIESMIKFFVTRGLHCDPSQIGHEEIMTFIRDYNTLSNLTKKSYIQIFSKWMISTDRNESVKEMDLLWPKSSRPGRKWARYDVAVEIFNAEINPLNKMILALAMDQGMRAVEISNVRIEDIDDNMIKVHGKGHIDGKVRYVPISKRVKEIYGEYLAWRNEHVADVDERRLIINRYGRPMTPHAVTIRVIDIGKKHGIDLTAHSLRRRFITDTLNSGVKIEVCSKIVGHESPAITALYYNCENQRIMEAMEIREKYVEGLLADESGETSSITHLM